MTVRRTILPQPRLLTEETLRKLEERLAIGCTIEVSCDSVGIKRQSFYNWMRASVQWCALGDANPRMPVPLDIVPILTFLTRITRAQAQAKVVATAAAYSGLIERRTVEQEPYQHVETRFMKGKHGEDVPYRHEETRFRQVERIQYPDWHAGIEFLKRRDPENWNPPTRVEVSFEQKAVRYIRSGEVTFEALEKAYGNERAVALFEAAGVPIPAVEDVD